ncbi:hypothetical protein K3U94_21825 [Mycolicibacter heraklionensis]|uniref:Uncharacterized protein n=1 Tax=Mycolicibacter heraklionensis TaxID=512402 RepID=A0A9X7WG64_9MYCO|nr:hypothetical protein [Mycolicibacter heraklionensis]QZA07531.1 hypothetical protein K3U94_21825 [Mycolicibacter heraklionensis]
MGSLSVLAAGLGIGAALAATPGVAFAGTSPVDGGAGALGVAGALAAADIGDAAATVGTAAAVSLPTLPDGFGNFAISISGVDLVSLGTASASSSLGNFAIAYGAYSDANAMSGFFNYASAEGDHSLAVVGDTGWFNYASAVGDHSSAAAAWGNGNVATATGDYAVASAGASVVAGVYDSHYNTATAEGLHAIAYSGWDGSSNNTASAIGDYIQDYSPEGNPFNPGDATDFWADLWHLFS